MGTQVYISARKAGAIAGVNPKFMSRIAKAANIRRFVMPGMPVRFHREDVERLAREAHVGGPVEAEVPELAGVS